MRALIIAACLLCTSVAHAQMVPAEIGNTRTSKVSQSHFAKSGRPRVQNGELRVALEVDRTSAYVNEQVLVTLRVIAPAVAFNITGDDLTLDNVDVVSLHREKTTIKIDDMPHQQSETVFAVFAREPGVIDIPALSFNAVLPVPTKGSTEAQGNPTISASTPIVRVSIDAVPSTASQWLPAQNVEVASGWSANKEMDVLRAGEPVTRHVSIKVTGQHPGAIPEFALAEQLDVRTYPAGVRIETEKRVSGLTGTLTQSYTVIASYPGSLTLPAIDINWWHIDDGQWRTTTLPAEQLQVLASTSGEASSARFSSRTYEYFIVGMLALILALAGVCLILWRRNRQLALRLAPVRSLARMTERDAWSVLQQSIRARNPVAIRQSILQWAKVRWPESQIHRLEQLPLKGDTLRKELRSLDEYLFRHESSQLPDFKAMKKSLKLERKQKAPDKQSRAGLSEVYPDV